MWSSLSTYLYNDDVEDVAASSPGAAAATKRPPTRINNTPVNLRTPSPRSSPLTLALSAGSNKGSAGKLHRSSFDKSDNVSILRGVIVGMKGAGKTTLIRRLRGEDPLQKQQSQSGQHQRSNVEKRKLMALVPWNVPTDTEKINNLTIDQEERVQLYVSESIGFLQSHEEHAFRKEWSTALQSQRGKEWNFVVWMIDPSMKDAIQYLQLGLKILFPAAAAASEKTKESSSVQHLCILLNFRDMQKDAKSSLLCQSREIVETVRKRIENVQSEQKDYAIRKSTTVPIVVYESSMFDCYGLQQLHSFITLPYLAQKEEQLLCRAKLVQKQQLQLTKTLMESKAIDYSDFIASDNQVVIEEKPDKHTIQRRKLEEEKERLKKQLKQQKQVLDSKMHRRKSPVILGNQIISNEQPKESQSTTSAGHTRKLFKTPSKSVVTKLVVVPTKVVVETSLESFFSEDESDDEVEAPRQIDKRSKPNVTKLKASSRLQVLEDSDDSSSDSDDSDDDFYIDISGARSSPHFAKKASPSKIEPTVSVDSTEGSKSNIGGKDGDAKEENTSNENGVDKSGSDSGSVRSGSSAAANEEDEQENAVESPEPNHSDSEHEGGNPNAEEDKQGNDVDGTLKPNKEDDAGHEDGHSAAGEDKEEEDGDASNDEEKEKVDTDETFNTGDGEVKANGGDLGVESKLPDDETNVEDDTATDEVDETVEASGITAETDSSDAESTVIKNEDATEEEKTASTPPKRQILDEDDHVSEEENTATATSPSEQQTLDDDDGGDESEDEFIIPASEERQVYDSDDESSKLGRDAGKAVREVDNVNNNDGQQKAVPTQPVKRGAEVTETKTNGASTSSKTNSAIVSSAALAAIEEARLQAEKMMAQSQPAKPTKEKKKKEKVKKEKKAKKSKKKSKEESS